MAVVNLIQLEKHALEKRYKLGMISVCNISTAKGVLKQSLKLNSPVVLLVNVEQEPEQILPSLELLSRQTKNAIAIVGCQIQTAAQAVRAIRLGCNGLLLDREICALNYDEIVTTADSCGIPVLEKDHLSSAFFNPGNRLEELSLSATGQSFPSWKAFEKKMQDVAAEYTEELLENLQGNGEGRAALDFCQICQPVEHLIIYNSQCDPEKTQELAATGRQVLDNLPGVRQTWSGRAVKSDAKFQCCWLIRFANETVIDSYREHPEHVAYADNHFRPFAGDRVSIDYQLIGSEEEKDSDD